jgi:hypothetical protein
MVNADTLQPGAIAISRLQSMQVAISRIMHVACASYDGTAIEHTGYGICRPEMLLATTSRWISDVPSKIV